LADIQIERRHQLGLAAIREQADALAEQLAGRFGGTYAWRENSLLYDRSGVNACIECTSKNISVDIKLGLMMSALRSTIEAEVTSTLDKYLG
jgi:putative polyhydroxyalkanoate system protein